MRTRNTAVVMAAGRGKRFGKGLPKQFVKVKGREILAHAMKGFEKEPAVDSILVVVERRFINFTKQEIVKRYGFKKVIGVIAGGRERYDSVYNALVYLRKFKPKNIVIHDGARPVFDAYALKAVLASLKSEVAVIPVMRVIPTIKQVNNGYVVQTIDRDILRASVTPQGYKYSELLSLYSAPVVGKLKPTDEAFVFENVGYRVKAVEHEGFNLKVTTAEDINVLESYFESQKLKVKAQK